MINGTLGLRLMGLIGNILSHYDKALLGILTPFIAPLFFSCDDPLVSLILTYSILPLGAVMRPLGSLFFGWIGDHKGRIQALFYSLSGMALVTVGIGCLPSCHVIGNYAFLLLALGKMAQDFCAAGETIGGAIFVLEHTSPKKRDLLSGIFDASSIIGVIIASAWISFLSYTGTIEKNWRVLFWFGGMSASIGAFLRFKLQKKVGIINFVQKEKINLLETLKEHKRLLISIVIVAGFVHTTYSVAFILMNGFIPLITSMTTTKVMQSNTILLAASACLLPAFGFLASKIGRERVMITSAIFFAFIIIPLFYALNMASQTSVFMLRFLIVILGSSFSASYYSWSVEHVSSTYRYTILSLGYALGSQLIGTSTSSVCLWLYYRTKWLFAPAIYLAIIAGMAGYVIYRSISASKTIKINSS